jgi:uncharacterized protein (TIGR02246 family)
MRKLKLMTQVGVRALKRESLLQFSICILTGVMLLVAGCSPYEEEDLEAVAAAVNDIWSQYSSSLNSGDLDLWMSLWTDDGVQMPPNSPPVIGKDQIRARNKGVLDQFTFNMDITNEEIRMAGEWAFARGTYRATLTPKDGGEATFIDGKYMTILKKQPDGSWKIHRDMFNSNVPPGKE